MDNRTPITLGSLFRYSPVSPAPAPSPSPILQVISLVPGYGRLARGVA
jgi:hypothetical protein